MPGITPSDLAPRGRIVLLGASNLTRSVSIAVETARLILGSPLECFLAMGHGRSWGRPSRVLGRTLPGIVECGVWRELAARPGLPTWALVTDIGNDVAYGADVGTIAGWVKTCLDRLEALRARVVVTSLPLPRLRRLSPLAFQAARAVFFPTRPIGRASALAAAEDLDRRVRAMAAARGAALVEQPLAWYGLDPLHIRRRDMPGAWVTILAGWGAPARDGVRARPSLARWIAIRRRTPEHWRLLGAPLGRPQPCGRLSDGSRLWMF